MLLKDLNTGYKDLILKHTYTYTPFMGGGLLSYLPLHQKEDMPTVVSLKFEESVYTDRAVSLTYLRYVSWGENPFIKKEWRGRLEQINRLIFNYHVIMGLIEDYLPYGFMESPVIFPYLPTPKSLLKLVLRSIVGKYSIPMEFLVKHVFKCGDLRDELTDISINQLYAFIRSYQYAVKNLVSYSNDAVLYATMLQLCDYDYYGNKTTKVNYKDKQFTVHVHNVLHYIGETINGNVTYPEVTKWLQSAEINVKLSIWDNVRPIVNLAAEMMYEDRIVKFDHSNVPIPLRYNLNDNLILATVGQELYDWGKELNICIGGYVNRCRGISRMCSSLIYRYTHPATKEVYILELFLSAAKHVLLVGGYIDYQHVSSDKEMSSGLDMGLVTKIFSYRTTDNFCEYRMNELRGKGNSTAPTEVQIALLEIFVEMFKECGYLKTNIINTVMKTAKR